MESTSIQSTRMLACFFANRPTLPGTPTMSDAEPQQTETNSFRRFDLHPAILSAVDHLGYEQPSPIQAQTIPVLLSGRDLVGQAQTGTGKTAAFALPLLSLLDVSVKQPQLLVLAPTRELAIQVAEACKSYARNLSGFHVLPIYGGQHIGEQLRALRRGVQVIVGTPGRIIDHLNRNTLDLSALQALVLDEADEMLRMGFIDDVEQILEQTPAERQTALFSATMPHDIRRVAERYLRDPEHIRIQAKTTTVETVRQRFIQVNGTHKMAALTRVLEVERFEAILIFTRTKTATVELAQRLEARGYRCSALNGDMNQATREHTVDQLKRGAIDIVCATDVAARGLDVDRISHVINYDIPADTEAYVHRIGRTGRAGRTGAAILFVTPRERHQLRAIERATRQNVQPMRLPTHDDLANRRVADFKSRITETIESQDLEYLADLIDAYSTEHDVETREIAAALAHLLQKNRPLIPQEPDIPESHRETREQRPNDRHDRQNRPPWQRSDGPPASAGRQPIAPARSGMQRFRIAIGREHGLQARHVVGAIANEAGLASNAIGPIHIFHQHSIVDLPEGMPADIQKHLKGVWVLGQQLRLREWRDDAPARSDNRDDRRPPYRGRDGNRHASDNHGDRPPKRRANTHARSAGGHTRPADTSRRISVTPRHSDAAALREQPEKHTKKLKRRINKDKGKRRQPSNSGPPQA